MRHRTCFSPVFAFLLCSSVLAQTNVPPTETQAFLDARPGSKAMLSDGRVAAIFGVPLEINTAAVAADSFVDSFVQANKAAFGSLNPTQLNLVQMSRIDTRDNKFTVYTYQQRIEGLEVHGAAVKIPMLQAAPERIPYVGIGVVDPPTSALTADGLNCNPLATLAASTTYGHLQGTTVPQKVVYLDQDGTLHRAWRFAAYSNAEAYHLFVDTSTCEIVGAEDMARYINYTLSGTARGHFRGCCPVSDPSYPSCCGSDTEPSEEPAPLGYLTVRALDQQFTCPSTNGEVLGQDVTSGVGSTLGEFSIPGLLDPPGRAIARLTGEWVTVLDCGYSLSDCLPVSAPDRGMCNLDALLATLPGIEACEDVTGPTANLVFDPGQTPAAIAQVTAYEYITRSHDWFAALQPNFEPIHQSIPVVTNMLFSNAGYSPYPIPAIRTGVGGPCTADITNVDPLTYDCLHECNNWAVPSALTHEYGHFLLDRLLPFQPIGGADRADPFRFTTFHEAIADTFSALMLDSSIVGWQHYIDRDPSFVRDLNPVDEEATNPLGIVNARFDVCQTFPLWCDCEVLGQSVEVERSDPHCRALPLSQAFWDLRHDDPEDPEVDGIGLEASRKLFSDFLMITRGAWHGPTILAEILVADDDDGDLSSVPPTPHYSQILSAFGLQHGFVPPTGQPDGSISVSWVGPEGQPQAEVDYTINWSVSPPVIVLKTTESNGLAVIRWTVSRKNPATGDALDLGAVVAEWGGPAHNVTVALGDGITRLINNVHIVDLPKQSNGTWTNAILNLDGSVFAHVRVEASASGEGGFISGQVGRSDINATIGKAIARGVGVETGGAATLSIPRLSYHSTMELGAHADGAMLELGSLQGGIQIASDLHGDLVVERWSNNQVNANGKLVVAGTGTSSGDIVVGELFEGGQITFAGDYAGEMNLGNVKPSFTIPPRIEVENLTGSIVMETFLGTVGGQPGGTIAIHGDMSGAIEVTNSEVQVTGDLLVDGDISGTITLPSISGNIIANADGVGGGSITGHVSIAGLFSGDICGDNLSADRQLPANIQIGSWGAGATICGVANACEYATDAIAASINPVEAVAKNRYITIVPPNVGRPTAIRVRLKSLPSAAPTNFAAHVGDVRWVWGPWDGEFPPSVFHKGLLGCWPYYFDWSEIGTLYVTGAEIVPGGVYEVQAFDIECELYQGFEANYSSALQLSTRATWGDITGDGSANLMDISAAVDAWRGAGDLPAAAKADIAPAIPNNIVDFVDIAAFVNAFVGYPYPYSGPEECLWE